MRRRIGPLALAVLLGGGAASAEVPNAVSPGSPTGAAEPVLKQQIPGSASSWTPPLGSCLERGGEYAWSVRALGVKSRSEWSPPSLFGVAAGPSREELETALALVQQ